MSTSSKQRREAFLAKTEAELAELFEDDLFVTGNAFSQVLIVKGELSIQEYSDGLLCGADGIALRSALTALGYAPEDWCGIASVRPNGLPVNPSTLREFVSVIDPTCVLVCDESAATSMREAYAEELAGLPSFEEATLMPGLLITILGIRVLNLGGFASALESMEQKQLMWAWLKQVPPLGEPY